MDSLPHVTSVKIRIGAVNLHSFVPDDRLHTELGFPVKFYKGRFSPGINQAIGVNAKSFHETKRARDCAIGHDPHRHVNAFRHERYEIPEIVVGSLRLRKAAVGLLLSGVDQVGKLDRVLYEKYRNVVADDVPVTFLGVKLHGEAAHVSREIGRSFVARYGREPDERWCLLSWPLKQVGARKLSQRLVIFEIAVFAEASSMNNAFWNAFMIEVKNLFPKVGVFHRGRPARPNSERILVVGNRRSLLSGQRRDVISRDLVKFTAGSVARFLVIQFRGLGLAID